MTAAVPDPAVQVAAADLAGPLVARGHLDPDTFVPLLVDAALRAGHRGNPHGLRLRLLWRILDGAAAHDLARDLADPDAYWAALRAMERRLPARDVLGAAEEANRRRGGPLTEGEVREAADRAAADFLRRLRGRARG